MSNTSSEVVGATHSSPKLHLMNDPPCGRRNEALLTALGWPFQPLFLQDSEAEGAVSATASNALEVFDNKKSAMPHHKSHVRSFTVAVRGERYVRWPLLLEVSW